MGYARPSSGGERWMLYNRVICGEWVPGKSHYKEPPPKHRPETHQNYESMYSKIEYKQTIPEIVVTANDGQAYPLFVFVLEPT